MTQHYATFQSDLVAKNNVCYTTCPDLKINFSIAIGMSHNETSHYVA